MTIYVDIDNTICVTSGNDYPNSTPIKKNIDKINRLFDEGNEIIYWTSRGAITGRNWEQLTTHQLYKWGAKFHKLDINNKPSFDLLIDDKATNIDQL